MTLRQWVAFIMSCYLSSPAKWDELASNTDRKEKGNVNLYQICDTYVKPWTRNRGSSIALLLNRAKPLKAALMISHAWGEDILESLVGVLCKASAAGIPCDTPIWFCTFAQYQPGDEEGDCGPGVAAQLALDPFKCVIASRPRFGMLVLHTSAVELYGRLWCVYEVNASQEADVVPFAAMSMKYFLGSYKAMQEGQSVEALCTCRSEDATCWSLDDAKTIKAEIEAGIGYAALDDKIISFRSAALQQMLKAQEPLLTWAEPLAKKYGMSVVDMMSDMVERFRATARFVALAYLLQEAEGHESTAYMLTVVEMAKSLLDAMKCGDEYTINRGEEFNFQWQPPPGFDPAKRVPDVFLDELKVDDKRLLHCLRTAGGEFQHPIAWLELGAGGKANAMSQARRDAEWVIKIFQSRDGEDSGTISKDRLKYVLLQYGMLSEDDLEHAFSSADADQDGLIDYKGFISWLFGANIATD